MGTAILHAAEPHVVSLDDAFPVDMVDGDIVPFVPACLARADSLMVFNVGAMLGAEVAPAVLADLDGRLLTPREPPAELAGCRPHMEAPEWCTKAS